MKHEHLVHLKCEELGMKSTPYHIGWIPLEITIEELAQSLNSDRVRVVKTNGVEKPLRNEHEVQFQRNSGRWEYMVTIGENHLSPEKYNSAWVADSQFDRLMSLVRPDETSS